MKNLANSTHLIIDEPDAKDKTQIEDAAFLECLLKRAAKFKNSAIVDETVVDEVIPTKNK